eukprot:COSAG01_NODE_7864_length_3019_cov_76.927080_1_plen_230_part_00
MAWTLLPCAEHVAPTAAAETATLKQLLQAVATHFHASGHAAKEHVNLEALAEHCGITFAAAPEIPDEVFGRLQRQLGLVPFVLRGGVDAMVLLADFHGALKGLPPNERANRLCDACGLPYRVRGDVFIGRLSVGVMGPELGGDASPEVALRSEWMKAVHDANQAGMGRRQSESLANILSPHLRMAVLQAKEAIENPPPAPALAAVERTDAVKPPPTMDELRAARLARFG